MGLVKLGARLASTPNQLGRRGLRYLQHLSVAVFMIL